MTGFVHASLSDLPAKQVPKGGKIGAKASSNESPSEATAVLGGKEHSSWYFVAQTF